ncbi:MAG: arylesterase, partial [Ottowia sp.]|nr:arylesterase [Ottowia sp.]
MQRRNFICMALAGAATTATTAAAQGAPQGAQGASAPVLLVLGDSLSAEYGIARGSGWVALLERRLAEKGRALRIVNASISGDTTAGGRRRLAALLARHKPAVLVVELGSNDALQGTPLDTTRANLAAIIQAGKAAGARVLLTGQQMPPNYGADYTARFAALFGE